MSITLLEDQANTVTVSGESVTVTVTDNTPGSMVVNPVADNTFLRLDSVLSGSLQSVKDGAGSAAGLKLSTAQAVVLAGNAAAPGLAVGSVDTGLYESVPGVIGISTSGAVRFLATATQFRANNGAALLNEVPSETNPVLVPYYPDPDTGVGWASANALSLIAAGDEVLRVVDGGLEFRSDGQIQVKTNEVNAGGTRHMAFGWEYAGSRGLLCSQVWLSSGNGTSDLSLERYDSGTAIYLDLTDAAGGQGRIRVGAGTLADPGLVIGSTVTGLWDQGGGAVNWVAAGVEVLGFRTTGLMVNEGNGAFMKKLTPSATVPGFTWSGDEDTGVGRAGANQLSLIAAATEFIRIGATAVSVYASLQDGGGADWQLANVGRFNMAYDFELLWATAPGDYAGAKDLGLQRYDSGTDIFLRVTDGSTGIGSAVLDRLMVGGNSGPMIQNNSGAIRARNNADTANVNVECQALIAGAQVQTGGYLFLGGAGGPVHAYGTGSPEGVVSAPIGSMYSRTDGGSGTSMYVKESGTGNTGWVAK